MLTLLGCVKTVYEAKLTCNDKQEAEYVLPPEIKSSTEHLVRFNCKAPDVQTFDAVMENTGTPEGYSREIPKDDYLVLKYNTATSIMQVRYILPNRQMGSQIATLGAGIVFLLLMAFILYRAKSKQVKMGLKEWIVSPLLAAFAAIFLVHVGMLAVQFFLGYILV
jgi:hypothetical protein